MSLRGEQELERMPTNLENIERQYGIHGGPWAPRSTCGYFYCDESKEPAKKNGQKRCTCCLYPQHRRIHLGRPGLVLDCTLHHLLPPLLQQCLDIAIGTRATGTGIPKPAEGHQSMALSPSAHTVP